jgi:hypothetical protein
MVAVATSCREDPETGKTLVLLTNQGALPALTICALYKSRWQVELLFKWIKQHLRIKPFYGTSENAVKIQIWIAVSVYVLVAIVRKRFRLEASLYTFLQVISVTGLREGRDPIATFCDALHIRGGNRVQQIESVYLLTGQQC